MEEVTKEKMEIVDYYNVQAVVESKYRQGWRFLTLWETFGMEETTRGPSSAFVQPDSTINQVLVRYSTQKVIEHVPRQVEFKKRPT